MSPTPDPTPRTLDERLDALSRAIRDLRRDVDELAAELDARSAAADLLREPPERDR